MSKTVSITDAEFNNELNFWILAGQKLCWLETEKIELLSNGLQSFSKPTTSEVPLSIFWFEWNLNIIGHWATDSQNSEEMIMPINENQG